MSITELSEPFVTTQHDQKETPNAKNSKSNNHVWMILLVRIMADFVFKNPLLFLANYSKDLQVTETQFSFILIWTNIGCIFAASISQFNERLLKTYPRILIVHLMIAAIGTLLFIIPSWYPHEMFVLIWCSACRFIVGISFSFISAASIKLATSNVSDSGELSNIIATLHYSWALSTVLNIPCGYILEYISWKVVFITMGIMLSLSALFVKLIFEYKSSVDPSVESVTIQADAHYHLQDEEELEDKHIQENGENGVWTLLTHKNSILILITSFSNGTRSIVLYILSASLWMEDVFDLSEYLVGWTTLTQITGELFAAFLVSLFAYKYKIWKLTFAALIYQYLSNITLLILSLVYGNSVGGLAVALVITFALVMSHQSFYVVSQSNSVQYAPTVKLSFLLLVLQRMAQEAGSVLAIIITPMIWQTHFDHGIFIFSLLFSFCTVITTSVMQIYRSQPLDYVQ